MRVVYKSTSYKLGSVIRYLFLKVAYPRKLKIGKLSMIGRHCGVYIKEEGKIECRGRIILNDGVMLFSKGSLSIGKQFGINSYSRIVAHDQIEIGDNVTIGQMVSILDHDHDYKMKDGELKLDGYKTAPIKIGNNVWIGDKSTILRGVNIGNNVVIAANTVINKDVPNNCVVGGIPFKILKEI